MPSSMVTDELGYGNSLNRNTIQMKILKLKLKIKIYLVDVVYPYSSFSILFTLLGLRSISQLGFITNKHVQTFSH